MPRHRMPSLGDSRMYLHTASEFDLYPNKYNLQHYQIAGTS